MPLYEHFCSNCNTITQDVCKIDDRKQFVKCQKCGGSAERIISCKIRRDEPTWLGSAVKSFADEDQHKIRDRVDFNRYLKEKNFIQTG